MDQQTPTTPTEPTTPAPTPTPLPNDPAARAPDGTLLTTPPTGQEPPKAEAPKAPEGAPEKYDIKAPEGFAVDEKAMTAMTPVFKELGLTNDQAQKLIDTYQGHAKSVEDAAIAAHEQTRTDWRNEIAKDPTLGNGSDNLKPEVQQKISAAIEALPQAMRQPFREAMDLTGAGDNPALVRGFYELAKLVTEGKPAPRGNPVIPAKPDGADGPGARALYPNNP